MIMANKVCKGNRVMEKNYPKIIDELISKSGSKELQEWPEHHFEELLEEIDRTMDFFTVHVRTERLDETIRKDERYIVIREYSIGNMVEERTRYYWLKRNKEFLAKIETRIDEIMARPEHKHVKEWKLEETAKLKDQAIQEVIKEVEPMIIELLKNEYKGLFGEQWETHWEKTDIFEPRTEREFWRRYDMPTPFRYWDSRNSWQQFFFARDSRGSFYYQRGGSGSSSQRYNHCNYGHFFAVLNDERPIPTYFFVYDDRNNFIFEKSESDLWLNLRDIDATLCVRESREILRNVHSIE